MKHCNKCGTKLRDNVAEFCHKCGNKLKREIKHEVTEINRPKKPIFFWIAIIILLIGLGIAFEQGVHYYNKYNEYLDKYNYQVAETNRYQNLYKTEEQAKNNEVNLRRQKEAELSNVQSTLQAKNTEISGLRGTLSEEENARSGLQSELSTTQQALGQSTQQSEVIQKEVAEIMYNINSLESWVKENAYLPSDDISKIHSLCGDPLERSGNMCIIDVEKMGKDMGRCIGFRWVDDTKTSNFATGERIFDLNTFWQSKEGDCDDFAFFMTAWIRKEYERAKTICSDSSIRIKMRSSTFSSNAIYINCPCNIYHICGHITKWGGGGHCEVGITNYGNPYSGASFYSNLEITEPQSGEYDGKTQNVFDSVWSLFTENDYLGINNNQVSTSIQSAKQKIQSIT